MAIRLSPKARTNRLVAIARAAEGGHVLKATVTAPAESGRANEALLRLLVRTWDLPRQDPSIITGLTSRNKIVQVAGEPRRLIEKVTPEIAHLPGR